jgi:hypothetical protein
MKGVTMATSSDLFRLNDVQYIETGNTLARLAFFCNSAFNAIVGFQPPPTLIANNDTLGLKTSLTLLGRAINSPRPGAFSELSFYQSRYIRWKGMVIFLYILLITLFFPIISTSIQWIRYSTRLILIYMRDPYLQDEFFVQTFIIATAVTIFLFVSFSTILRISSLMVDRSFAETLCVVTIINILLDISRDNVLKIPYNKRLLLRRIDYLARKTLLLTSRYLYTSATNRSWVYNHFRHMESFIRERERWVFAPDSTTLETLRDDFHRLLFEVYLGGNYGNFSWTEQTPASSQSHNIWKSQIQDFAPRILGVLLPVLLLVLLLWNPTSLYFIGLDNNMLSLILISWFLLSLDAVLKLGIIASLVSIAKGIKDLK